MLRGEGRAAPPAAVPRRRARAARTAACLTVAAAIGTPRRPIGPNPAAVRPRATARATQKDCD